MQIRFPQILIDELKPYASDILDRRAFGDALTNILKNAQGEFTLAIDGQWGDGATTNLKV